MNDTEETENQLKVCTGCGAPMLADRWESSAVCLSCIPVYPPSLLKAAIDPFDYALRLSTGEIIRFTSAQIHGKYARLHSDGCYNDNEDFHEHNPHLPYRFARGIDVRVDQIVWCADAPEGS